jgi:adenine phosphoribosyltransferase
MNLIKTIPNFPQVGVNFRDMSPLLAHPKERRQIFDQLAQAYLTTRIDMIVGLDARGFIIATALAERLEVGMCMARKVGKLPGPVETVEYALEYGTNTLQLQLDAIQKGQHVLIVDDILATGGTLAAAIQLVQKMGGIVSGLCCLLEIPSLKGQAFLAKYTSIKCLTLDTMATEAKVETPPLNIKQEADFTILYHPSAEPLVRAVGQCAGFKFDVQPISWNHFPDGYPDMKFPADLCGKRVLFFGSMFDKNQYLEQLSVMMILGRQNIQSLDIILPYFAPATMERVEVPGIVATADTFAQITSCCLSPTTDGIPVLSVFDIHASTTRFSFSPKDVRFWPLSAVPRVMAEMDAMVGRGNYAVAFPDEGSYKRFRGTVLQWNPQQPYIVATKTRVGDQRKMQITEISNGAKDASGFCHVLIIDDLAQTGNTLEEFRKLLVQAGARHVSAYVTHAVFPNKAYMDFLPGGNKAGLENFWITDSNPQRSEMLKSLAPFRVLSLAPCILQDLFRRYFRNHSRPTLRVAIGSENIDKVNAVKQAYANVYPLHEVSIETFKCNSGVAEQPIDYISGYTGATNRINQVPGYSSTRHVIAMENFIEEKKEGWFDEGVVVIKLGNKFGNKTITKVTDVVPIDKEVMAEFLRLRKDQPDLTVGKVYQQMLKYDLSNWHLPVAGKNRSYLLQKALESALLEML